MSNQRFHLLGLVLLSLFLSLPVTAGYGETTEGTLYYECDLYRFEIARDGAWKSLQVNGVECLTPDADGSGYLGAPVLEMKRSNTLIGKHDGRTLKVYFSDDFIDFMYWQEGQRGVEHIRHTLADHFSWAVFPRTDGQTYPIPAGRRLDNNHGARFLSSQGAGFEMHRRTYLSEEPNPRDFGTYIYPDGKNFMIVPIAKIDPKDLLQMHFDGYPENHFFEPGPMNLPTKVENAGNEPIEITVVSKLESYNTNAPGEVLQTRKKTVTIPGGKTIEVPATFDPVEPGPYEFEIVLEYQGEAAKKARGTMIYDPERWDYPDLEPKDFDAFWERTLQELRSKPLDVKYEEITDHRGVPEGFKYVSFNGLGDRRVRGLLGIPKGLKPGQKVRAKLGLPGAGYGAAPPDSNVLARGEVMLALSIHDIPFGGESGRHHPKKYWYAEPYQGMNRNDKDEYYYRYAYAAAVRAVDFLRSLDYVDPDKIAVGGGSQGGSLTMAVAALVPDIERASAGVPGRIRWDLLTLKYRANCSFDAPEGMTKQEMFDEVLSYFDCGYMARRIRCPFTMHIGLKDEINPGVLQYWGFREIPDSVDKTMYLDEWGGH